ncbi:MAG: phosphoenolpyruvate carboxykinase (GTP) [Armatimonadota bacterium]
MVERLPAMVARRLEEFVALCRPDRVEVCDGSAPEAERLRHQLAAAGALEPLAWPDCHLHRSHPSDVARVESKTFICSRDEEGAGPTNRWWEPMLAKQALRERLAGSMRGRTLYVVPYAMGPIDSPYARVGVQFTDSPYVVLSMRTMTRMGDRVLERMGAETSVVIGFHGMAELDPETRAICHFPDDLEIWSVGSNYGGNALLGKKCFALRIASAMGRREGWLAEHMLLLELTDPAGRTWNIAAAFPSACGKTNLAMLESAVPGWKVRTLGDDIAWLHPGADGRLRAINPEAGFFGVVPGTSDATNPVAMDAIRRETIFTNVAVDDEGNPWWEGCGREPGPYLTDWKGNRRSSSDRSEPFAHPNARFTVSMERCRNRSEHWDNTAGIPIDAILFGGRRDDTAPLVVQAFDWRNGVYMGATMASRTTAAAEGTAGALRRDPMAMLPFCGYHIGDYLGHWLAMERSIAAPPSIFHVNWFRRDAGGRYLWPGFGDNLRVLQWIVGRLAGEVDARRSPIGWIPDEASFPLGDVCSREDLREALSVRPAQWRAELKDVESWFASIGTKLPADLERERRAIARRFGPALHRAA